VGAKLESIANKDLYYNDQIPVKTGVGLDYFEVGSCKAYDTAVVAGSTTDAYATV
jgi:hypothetical protein